MLARRQRGQGVLLVPVVRRADKHGVNARLRQQLAIVAADKGIVTVVGPKIIQGDRPDVTPGDQTRTLARLVRMTRQTPATTTANHTNAQIFRHFVPVLSP